MAEQLTMKASEVAGPESAEVLDLREEKEEEGIVFFEEENPENAELSE